MNDLTEQVYQILKRRRYNREKPFKVDELKRKLHSSISNEQPIQLVGFWGVGTKTHMNWADVESLDFLLELKNKVKEVYNPSIRFEFIFSEAHGLHNGIPEERIHSYVTECAKKFTALGFPSRHLDSLWKKYGISFEKIENLLEGKEANWWQSVRNHADIELNAQRRNQRLSPLDAAQRYVIMRQLEREMWQQEYPDAIFHTFSDSRLRDVLPDLPTLYLYARKGWSNTPWFVDTEKEV